MSFPGYKLSINDDHLHSAANIRARAIVDAGIARHVCLLTEFTVKCIIFFIIYLHYITMFRFVFMYMFILILI